MAGETRFSPHDDFGLYLSVLRKIKSSPLTPEIRFGLRKNGAGQLPLSVPRLPSALLDQRLAVFPPRVRQMPEMPAHGTHLLAAPLLSSPFVEEFDDHFRRASLSLRGLPLQFLELSTPRLW